MPAPAVKLSVTDRYKLKELTLEQSQAVTPGRIMWCRGRKILGYGSVADLARVLAIPPGTDTVVLSIADAGDVREWLQ